MSQNIQLLIKPASSSCNENCSYCFYADEASNRSLANRGIMDGKTSEALIRRAYEYSVNACDFIFQGGEPLLAGLDFFKDFVNTARRINDEIKADKPLNLSWSVQTNASLIDDAWAEFFKDNNFLVGVSVDGPKEIHDSQRGAGSFERTIKGIEKLQAHRVNFNVLCVVTEESCRHAGQIYEFFKGRNFEIQQYISCLETSGNTFAPKAENFGNFLCDIFDLWEKDIKNGRNISIRYFENIARVLLGMMPESCGMAGKCSLQFTIESDGDVYPCDFYALDEYKLGNINQNSFTEIAKSDKAIHFTVPYNTSGKCRECKYYKLCRGGCKRERNAGNPDCTRLCEGYLIFYKHAVDRLWILLNQNLK